MEYISSDTNVWIDFSVIQRMDYPFRLPYTYIMFHEAIENEMLSPGLSEAVSYGLVPVKLTTEEFFLAEDYGGKYIRLSLYDRIALAIAKKREIVLLTGDGALRKAAAQENVKLVGTLGILDQLLSTRKINVNEYIYCLEGLMADRTRRLPRKELEERIRSVTETK